MKDIFLILNFILIFITLIKCEPLTFEIAPSGSRCFYEDIGSGIYSTAEIFVLSGGKLDIALQISGPFRPDENGLPQATKQTKRLFSKRVRPRRNRKDSLLSELNQEKNPNGEVVAPERIDFEEESEKWSKNLPLPEPFAYRFQSNGGIYEFCLDNTFSSFSSKYIQFEVKHKKYDVSWEKTAKAKGIEPLINKEESNEEVLKEIYEDIDTLANGISKIRMQQKAERQRLALHSNMNENAHSQFVIGSFIETIIFITVSLFQIFYVRRWFEGKSYVGLGLA